MKETKDFSCDNFDVGGYSGHIYISVNTQKSQYLFSDGKVRNWSEISDYDEANKLVYFKTTEEAEKFLKEFKRKMCKSANVVSKQQIYLQLENETSPIVQPITARLVTDHSGGRIVLQVQTPDSPEFIAVARLAVKDGKVVMFREQDVESEFINTDSQGRIQN